MKFGGETVLSFECKVYPILSSVARVIDDCGISKMASKESWRVGVVTIFLEFSLPQGLPVSAALTLKKLLRAKMLAQMLRLNWVIVSHALDMMQPTSPETDIQLQHARFVYTVV